MTLDPKNLERDEIRNSTIHLCDTLSAFCTAERTVYVVPIDQEYRPYLVSCSGHELTLDDRISYQGNRIRLPRSTTSFMPAAFTLDTLPADWVDIANAEGYTDLLDVVIFLFNEGILRFTKNPIDGVYKIVNATIFKTFKPLEVLPELPFGTPPLFGWVNVENVRVIFYQLDVPGQSVFISGAISTRRSLTNIALNELRRVSSPRIEDIVANVIHRHLLIARYGLLNRDRTPPVKFTNADVKYVRDTIAKIPLVERVMAFFYADVVRPMTIISKGLLLSRMQKLAASGSGFSNQLLLNELFELVSRPVDFILSALREHVPGYSLKSAAPAIQSSPYMIPPKPQHLLQKLQTTTGSVVLEGTFEPSSRLKSRDDVSL